MAYYTKVLQPGETVKYIADLHWTIYRKSILFGLLTILAGAFTLELPADDRAFGWIGIAILALLTITTFLGSWFVRVTTEVVVTDKRIIHKTGWIARRTQEIGITKVETVDVRQGIMGRILGYGTVLITGIGGSWEPLRKVASPLDLRNAIIVG